MRSGEVLVAGGTDGQRGSTSSELYNPVNKTWTVSGNLGVIRRLFTMTPLLDGRVLAAGGFQDVGGMLASAELYDPATGTWTPTGAMATPRSRHWAVPLQDGRVLVGGGTRLSYYEPLPPPELYDPATGTWTHTGPLPTADYGGSAAALLADGRVLVAGGEIPLGARYVGSVSSAYLYDPATGTWTATGKMGTGRIDAAAVSLRDGRILVAGGGLGYGSRPLTSAELYNPATGTWSATGSLPYCVTGPLVLLPDGRVLAADGCDPTTRVGVGVSQLYDPTTGAWTAVSGPLEARSLLYTVTRLLNGDVLLAGGTTASGVLSSAERYTDPYRSFLPVFPIGVVN